MRPLDHLLGGRVDGRFDGVGQLGGFGLRGLFGFDHVMSSFRLAELGFAAGI
jgi:hypothetical protein